MPLINLLIEIIFNFSANAVSVNENKCHFRRLLEIWCSCQWLHAISRVI